MIALSALSSCSLLNTTTRGTAYPKMYEEKPTSILIMPPINNTNAVEAKDYFYTSLAQPLSEKGYYVLSPFLAMNVLQEESAYDSEMFIDANLKPFNTIFGAVINENLNDEIIVTVIATGFDDDKKDAGDIGAVQNHNIAGFFGHYCAHIFQNIQQNTHIGNIRYIFNTALAAYQNRRRQNGHRRVFCTADGHTAFQPSAAFNFISGQG